MVSRVKVEILFLRQKYIVKLSMCGSCVLLFIVLMSALLLYSRKSFI